MKPPSGSYYATFAQYPMSKFGEIDGAHALHTELILAGQCRRTYRLGMQVLQALHNVQSNASALGVPLQLLTALRTLQGFPQGDSL